MTPQAALPAPAMVASDRLAALERDIRERIREFEVPALLALLATIGYGAEDLEFRAHRASGPQPTLLHAIEFPPRPGPASARVVITLNLGLLSCRSPLPSYFQKFLQHIETHDPVIELIEVLDRSLLHTRLTVDRRERAVARWDRTRRNFLRVFGLDSPLGLHWLFRRVFPELGVEVRRISDEYRVPYRGATLGTSALGDCTFGDVAHIGVHDMEVLLLCEGAIYQGAVPWVLEGDRRLRSVVFPLLDEICMTLTVVFILLDRGEGAQLGPTGYAGYNPMWRAELSPIGLPPTRVQIYRGALPRREPDSDQLELILADEPVTTLIVDAGAARFAEDTAIGCAVELAPVVRARGQRPYRYLATIHWGARAWFHDEPHAIRLECEGVPKISPTLREQPRLWAWLRDQARTFIADHLTREVLGARVGDKVSAALVERLIAEHADQHLHALALSRLVSMQQWEDEAWRRFASWRAP